MSDREDDSEDYKIKAEDGGLTRLDQYLDALSDRRRRCVLYYLKEEKTATVNEIAKHVTAHETNQPPSVLTEREYQPIQTELQHKHLPRLADFGLLDYDPRTGDVRFDDPPEMFVLLLSLSRLIENQVG